MKHLCCFVTAFSVLMLSVTGAAGAAGAAATSTTTTRSAPLIHVTIPSAVISLGYPADWTVGQFAGLPKATQKKLAKLNPQLESDMAQASTVVKSSKFYAEHPVARSDLMVNVVPNGGFPTTLADFRQGITEQFASQGATVQATSAKKIGGHTAYLVVATMTERPDATTTLTELAGQLYVPNGDGATIVTIATTDDADGRSLMDSIIASVRSAH